MSALGPESLWYVGRDNKNYGPYPLKELLAAHTAGHLADTDYLWCEQVGRWISAYEVFKKQSENLEFRPSAIQLPVEHPHPSSARLEISSPPSEPKLEPLQLACPGFGVFSVGKGTIELTTEGVTIQKKSANLSGSGSVAGLLLTAATAGKGGYHLAYSDIVSVNLSEGGWGSRPFLQISAAGDKPISDPEEALSNPACFVVPKSMLAELKDMKSQIERRVSAAKKVSRASSVSAADEIRKLADLRTAGIITQAEFDAKKRQLLGL